MSDVIKLLPDSVANQIAAGEVIQRPASVVKELVENAVDAGATSIQIILKDAGRTLIQVIDNGKGMSQTDARLSFERHSTSKIREASDLFSLHTMGFRGEALASIAAISQIDLKTQRKEDSIGTRIQINASECENQEPIYYGSGTNFMVKNIFFNVPARRKFLKSNQVEFSNIVKEFERLALVNYGIEFQLIHNDLTVYQFKGGTFKQRIILLFGKSFDLQLVPVDLDTSLIRIDGFVSKPENSRKRNPQQFLFVNGRYMRNPYFHKAIMTSYANLIPEGEQPNYFLNFTVDPETIDVNIHPTKTEIKFENEQSIWQILLAAVKESIGKFSVAPSIDFDTEDAPEIPVFTKETHIVAPEMQVNTNYNPFKSENNYPKPTQLNTLNKSNNKQDWEKLYENFMDKKNDIGDLDIDTNNSQQKQKPLLDDNIHSRYLQLKGKYILCPVKSGLMIIDQHRCHVKILYDKILRLKSSGLVPSQKILFPEILNLSVSESVILEDILETVSDAGFDLSYMGNNDWSINGIPSVVKDLEPKDSILQIINMVKNGGENIKAKIFENVALEIAKKSALPYGKILSIDEMDDLSGKLLQLTNPNYTPNGKLIIKIIELTELNKIFQ